MFKSIFQISILILLLFSNDVHGWCSPSDSGDCELKIRNGKKSTDANQRTVRFLNSKHTSAGAIMVNPADKEMKFVIGENADDNPTIRILKDKFEVTSNDDESFIVQGGMKVNKKLTVESALVLNSKDISQSSKTGSFITNGGIGIGENLYVGKFIEVESPVDSTDLNTGAVRLKGGLAVSKTANIQDLNILNNFNLLNGKMEVNGKMVVNAPKTKASHDEKALLEINGNIKISGKALFNNVLQVQDKKGFSGGTLLPSGGLQLFSHTRDAFIDFQVKEAEASGSDTGSNSNTIRVLQMGEESSLNLYNGKIVIDRKGYVGMGVIQPTHILHVDGQIRSSMSTIATASDRRLKKNIISVDEDESLNNILKLNVRDYEWKKNDKKQRGFIAQEVEKILPNAVQIVNDTSTAGSRNISDLRLLNLDPIIFDLVGSVQALQNQILAERNKRIELETEIKNLKRI